MLYHDKIVGQEHTASQTIVISGIMSGVRWEGGATPESRKSGGNTRTVLWCRNLKFRKLITIFFFVFFRFFFVGEESIFGRCSFFRNNNRCLFLLVRISRPPHTSTQRPWTPHNQLLPQPSNAQDNHELHQEGAILYPGAPGVYRALLTGGARLSLQHARCLLLTKVVQSYKYRDRRPPPVLS